MSLGATDGESSPPTDPVQFRSACEPMNHTDFPPRAHSFRAPVELGSNVEVTLKWFDPARGFGFVKRDDGSADALLPASLVQAAGRDSLPEGATLIVDLIEGRKGAQVSAVRSIDLSTATPPRPRPERRPFGADRHGPAAPRRSFDGPTTEMTGTVKWFNATKGFGFISPEGGERDVFVHIKALERSGLRGLDEGRKVRMTVRQGEKGLEAATISVAD